MERLLTVANLMDRWNCSKAAVYERIKKGVLKPCKNVPGTQFRLSDIEQAEGNDGYNPLTPFERRKLEQEVRRLKKENAVLTERLMKITQLAMQGVE